MIKIVMIQIMIGRPNAHIKTIASVAFCSFRTHRNINIYARCYKLLEVPNNSNEETVKKAFIELCKKYHPDSRSESASAEKFQEIESAYRTLLKKFSNDCIGEYGLYYEEKKGNVSDEVHCEKYDIKHTAPQHRQYLSYDGVGSGTPSQREKQYVKYRTAVAVEHVYEHHVKKLTAAEGNFLVSKNKEESKKIKTRYGIERLVEDLIQESIAKGHFDNLKGQGKPLPQSNYNPYVDFTTHKINQIMIENGFAPEWVNLGKEISDEIKSIKETLQNERRKFGPKITWSSSERARWQSILDNLRVEVDTLNKKINKYNLIVPILNKQKLHFDLKKESHDILMKDLSNKETN